MLIQFSVQNYKTFKEQNTISLVASYDKELSHNKFSTKFDVEVLKSAVIYGANASGKTKFVEALAFMKYFVLNSAIYTQKGDSIPIEPFQLNTESIHEPSRFEIIFSYKEVLYRYGYEVSRSEVVSEWLYYKPNVREVELFFRDRQTFTTHKNYFKQGKILIDKKMVRNNALLISAAAQFNDKISIQVIEWFRNLKVLEGLESRKYQGETMSMINGDAKKTVLKALEAADLGIEDLKLVEMGLEELPESVKNEITTQMNKDREGKFKIFSDVSTVRKVYDKNKKEVSITNLSMESDESAGTQKYFALIGPILEALKNGNTLVIDELDSNLHPILMCNIISLFNSEVTNRNNAQLIFNTHDTSLISSERNLFRRDQIWFVQKDLFGEAKLYSLADFKTDTVRKEDDFEFKYLLGKFGGVPYTINFETTIASLLWGDDEKKK